MTDISLPYDQVCEIIAETANEYAPGKITQKAIGLPANRMFEQFGHKLWRALEEAHLAKQAEGT